MINKIEKKNIIDYWVKSSDDDFRTFLDLYITHHNHWALFIGHLVIEKLLKALFVKHKNEYPPMIHDLRRICEKADVEIDMNRRIILDSITRFNINARYDDFKHSFYELCTDSFTNEWIEKIKECREWIKAML